jgi:hypothetical protein
MGRRITEKNVTDIRDLHSRGLATIDISRFTGIAKTTIDRIRRSGYDLAAYTDMMREAALKHKEKASKKLDDSVSGPMPWTDRYGGMNIKDILAEEDSENALKVLQNIHETLVEIKDGMKRNRLIK